MDLLFDIRDRAAEGKSQKRHAGDPAESAGDAESEEFPVRHSADTRYGRRKGPDDRDEACQDERLCAIFIVKILRPHQMVLVKEERIGAAEKLGAEMMAEPVAGVVARDGRESEERNEDFNSKCAFHRGEKSGCDKQGVAR